MQDARRRPSCVTAPNSRTASRESEAEERMELESESPASTPTVARVRNPRGIPRSRSMFSPHEVWRECDETGVPRRHRLRHAHVGHVGKARMLA